VDRGIAADDLAMVPPGARLTPGRFRHLVSRHPGEQPGELVGLSEIVLPRGGPNQKAGHHRLADVGRVEEPAKSLVLQAESDLAADERLEPSHKVGGGLVVASPDAADEVRELVAVGHSAP
jgi:hypothetical protein